MSDTPLTDAIRLTPRGAGGLMEDYYTLALRMESDRALLRHELSHLVRLMEPLEHGGSLNIPGLATLNAARDALTKTEGK